MTKLLFEKDLEEIKKILDPDEWEEMGGYFKNKIDNGETTEVVKGEQDIKYMVHTPGYCSYCNSNIKSRYSRHILGKRHIKNLKKNIMDITF